MPLTWGEDAWTRSPLASEEADYDYILMSELVFESDLHDELLWTMRRLCTPKTVRRPLPRPRSCTRSEDVALAADAQ